MFRFSPSDYMEMAKIWKGTHPEDGSALRVEDTIPEGFDPPELADEPQLTAPGIDPEMIAAAAAKRVFG